MERPAEPGVFCFLTSRCQQTSALGNDVRGRLIQPARSDGALSERCLANTRRLVFQHPSTYLAATDVLFEDRSLVAPGPETELDQGAFTLEPGLFFHQSADL